LPDGTAVEARWTNPAPEAIAASGKMRGPREKSQLMLGGEREASWALRSGSSTSDSDAMPPDAKSALDMLKI